MTPQEALLRAREFIGSDTPYVMATVDDRRAPQTTWMGALALDPQDENVFYITSMVGARKVEQLRGNPATQLMYSTPNYDCVVTLDGQCELVQDMDVKRFVWEAMPAAAEHFDRPESPEFGVIRFRLTCVEVLCVDESLAPVRVMV